MNDPKAGFIGKAVERREDFRFLTGMGQYTDDIALPGQTYGYFLRSPHAHAKIDRSTRRRRRRRPACWRSSPARTSRPVGGLPCGWLINSHDGSPMKEPKHPVLAPARCAMSATTWRWWSPRRWRRPRPRPS